VHVTVRLFASLRERAGTDSVQLELPDGARVGDALEHLSWLTEGSTVVMAVNEEYADVATTLSAGDELALIPPVSGGGGGAGGRTPRVRISAEPLLVQDVIARVRDPRAGAIVTFTGVTREVPALEYEAYVPMAERKLAELAAAAIGRHGLCAAAVEHRIGAVPLSEPSVIVAASAPHRDAAFAGARELIDELKATAPIWKREEGEWVQGIMPTAPPADPPS
jgi:MoaE-MoaD fusion protein